MSILQRLELLRTEMRRANVDIYLVPSIDAHNSEYVPECWQRRPWISGFDGSAGEVMVTLDQAYLWTDGRYFLQAEQQLNPACFQLMKQQGFVSETEQWLQQHAKGMRLGIDPQLVGIGRVQRLQQIMLEVGGEVVIIAQNLIDKCKLALGEESALPQTSAYAHAELYTGMSVADKLIWLRHELTAKNVDCIAFNVLDEIAWLFNIRGTDIEYNPLVISYALISQSVAIWFVDLAKVSPELSQTLMDAGVNVMDYAEFGDYLVKLNTHICLDDKTASYWMLQQAERNSHVSYARSPIVNKKALKNRAEQDGVRYAHVKDAVAMVEFLHWLENNWRTGVDEISAADKLAVFRGKQEHIRGLSFSTISGYAANGAIIHYRATPDTSKVIKDDSLYLLDSGGQYLEGTTDITRTVHLGEPTAEQKRHYTLVLKGHLALSRSVFVQGTCGENLDILARAPLWNEFLNYRHGTGHGVGSFLCVHEGPQRISQASSGVALLPGMIVSNEPGLYIDGSYGIRIENLCLVTEIEDPAAKSSEYGPFYQFEDLTLVPYCKKLIEVDLLSREDKQQLKLYYQRITEQVIPRLSSELSLWVTDQLAIF